MTPTDTGTAYFKEKFRIAFTSPPFVTAVLVNRKTVFSKPKREKADKNITIAKAKKK